jgi:hypothetical protein
MTSSWRELIQPAIHSTKNRMPAYASRYHGSAARDRHARAMADDNARRCLAFTPTWVSAHDGILSYYCW